MHQGCFVWTLTPPLAGGRTPRLGPVCVCVCLLFLAGSGGPASWARSGAPHPFLWPLCLSALLCPLRAGVAPVLVCCFFFLFLFPRCFFSLAPPLSRAFFGFRPRVPSALALCVVCFVGLALLVSPCALSSFLLPGGWPPSGGCPPPPSLSRSVAVPRYLALVFFFLFSAPPLSLALCVFRPRVPLALALACVCCARLSVLCVVFFCPPPLGSSCALACFVSPSWPVVVPWWLLPPLPLPFCASRFSSFALGALVFFSSLFVRLRCLRLSLVSGPGCPGPWRCVLLVFLSLPLPGSPCALASFVSPAWPLAALWWLLPPPPPLLCLAVFVAPAGCLGVLFFFFLCCAPPLSLAFSGFRPRVPWASALCVVCFVGLPLLGSLCALASFVLSAWPLAAPWWLLPPPPPPLCVSRLSWLPLGAVCHVLCCAVCPWVRCCAALLRVVPPGVVLSCAVLLCCARSALHQD